MRTIERAFDQVQRVRDMECHDRFVCRIGKVERNDQHTLEFASEVGRFHACKLPQPI